MPDTTSPSLPFADDPDRKRMSAGWPPGQQFSTI